MNSRRPTAKTGSQARHRSVSTMQGVATCLNANRDQMLKVQMTGEARMWLQDVGALPDASAPITLSTLKAALNVLAAKKDATTNIREGIKAVTLGLEEME